MRQTAIHFLPMDMAVGYRRSLISIADLSQRIGIDAHGATLPGFSFAAHSQVDEVVGGERMAADQFANGETE